MDAFSIEFWTLDQHVKYKLTALDCVHSGLASIIRDILLCFEFLPSTSSIYIYVYICKCIYTYVYICIVIPWYPLRLASRTLQGMRVHRCSGPLQWALCTCGSCLLGEEGPTASLKIFN